jgi:ABC-type dipeptide/oligopeptide/nickel transport system permease subunit
MKPQSHTYTERLPRPTTSEVPAMGWVVGRTLRGLRTFARRNPLSAFWGCVAALIILVAILAPLIAPYDPLKANFRRMAKAPDAENYFGTDQIGRDNLSRIIYGARASLVVAIAAVLLGTTTGSLWGLASGYIGGSFDIVSQRIIEFLQAFPDLILAMAISMALGTGHGTVIVAIAITRIPFGGRIVRAVALSLKEMAYVEAARAIGSSPLRIMARHVLPQCVAPYLILATTHLGVAIIIEAALGFLGVGIPPPTPTWGNMLAGSLTSLRTALVAGVLPRSRYYHHGSGVQPVWGWYP